MTSNWNDMLDRFRAIEEPDEERPRRGQRGPQAGARRRATYAARWPETAVQAAVASVQTMPHRVPLVDRACVLGGPKIEWSRWSGEDREAFRDRVRQDAARLNITTDRIDWNLVRGPE